MKLPFNLLISDSDSSKIKMKKIYQILPTEVMVNIFSYLQLGDLNSVSLVRKNWFQVTRNSKVYQNVFIKLTEINYDSFRKLNTKRNYQNIKFGYINFSNISTSNQFWNLDKTLLSKVKTIIFDRCRLTYHEFVSIICSVENLQELQIINCSFVGLKIFLRLNKITKILENLTSFKYKLLDNEERPNHLIKTLISMTPNVNYKEIRINNHFMLENYKDKLFDYNLTYICMSNNCINNCDLTILCNTLLNLKTLRIQNCDKINDSGIENLWKLKELEDFEFIDSSGEFSRCTSLGLINGFLRVENKNLKFLTLPKLITGENLLPYLSEMLPNLKELELYCHSGIIDNDLQMVWKNLRWLRKFKLGCRTIFSDFALTGTRPFDIKNLYKKGFSISRIKGLQILYLDGVDRITKTTLIEFSKLKELTELKLSTLETGKDLGILLKCKSLEKLKIEFYCWEAKEELKIKKQDFQRLKTLNLSYIDGY